MENVFAQKLKELRVGANWSLQQLADQVGVAKQSIHKFENAQAFPSSDTLLKIAEVFRVPFTYFYEQPATCTLENVKFRDAYKIHNQDVVEQEIKRQVIDYVTKFLQLERIMDIKHDFDNPLAGVEIENEKDIEKAAKILRKRWKLGSDAINDVVETLESKGVLVVEVDRVEDFNGLSGTIDEIPVIVLNERVLTVERKRFTALHELGHVFLEFAQEFSDEKVERFCDYFAGAVLLVDEALYYELGKNRTAISLGELKRIKESYGISIKAIIVRARFSGLINYQTFQEWNNSYAEWSHIDSKNVDFGQFRCNEKATRFKNLIVQGVTEGRLLWSKAAELSGRKIDVLKKEFDGVSFNVKN